LKWDAAAKDAAEFCEVAVIAVVLGNDWQNPLFDALSCKEGNHTLDGLGQA
jgi:hypothetical protein